MRTSSGRSGGATATGDREGVAAWTPGPWHCDVTDQGLAGRNAYVGVDAPESRCVVAHVICHDQFRNLQRLPYEANAALIAAAPAMYAALEEADLFAKNHGMDEDSFIRRQIRAALSQARGKS